MDEKDKAARSGKTCKGTAKRTGKQCKRSKSGGTEYCNFHCPVEPQEGSNYSYNLECPVCLESEGELFALNCKHLIHQECCKGLIKLECPICRIEITNLPEEVKETIKVNIDNRKRELEEEERMNLIRLEMMNILSRPPPQSEILNLVGDMRGEGIPSSFIPIAFQVDLPPEPVPRGILYDLVLGSILEHINRMNLDGDQESNDGDSDSDGDPFEEQNREMAVYPRRIEIRRPRDTGES